MNLQILDPKTRKNNRLSRLEELLSALREIIGSNSYNPETLDEAKIRERVEQLARAIPTGSLFNNLFSLKDLISHTDSYVSGGSKFLAKYKPPYNATVHNLLRGAGAINVVNSLLDEFGMGGSGLESFRGPIPNPINPEYITGGSSSGSAFLVGKGLVEFSVVSDTGDSARYPASNCNVFGFKPSYGAISRYGFYPFCSGFDSPAIMSTNLRKMADVFSTISKADPRDLNTLDNGEKNYGAHLEDELDPRLKIAVLRDTFWSSSERTQESLKIEEEFQKLLEEIREKWGVRVEIYDFPQEILRLADLVYRIISHSESISNYSNLTGLLFPFEVADGKVKIINRDSGNNYSETLKKNRSCLGNEFVFRQILGMHFLEGKNYENIYLKAKRYLSLINEEVENLFKRYDLILSPTADSIPPKINEYRRTYSPSNIKNILLLANFCSLPAISIPWIFVRGLPIGIHLMAGFREDERLLNVANHLSKLVKKER